LTANPLRISLTALAGVPEIAPGADLAAIVLDACASSNERLADGDVVVLAQKIISKAEGRLVRLADVAPSPRAAMLAASTGKDPRVVELILSESTRILRAERGILIVVHRLGFVLANAGIDQSNVAPGAGDQVALLLPADPDGTCERLRAALRQRSGANLAVVINDSLGRAWRQGTVGTALGASGLPAVHDLRGTPDRHGRILRATEVGLADEIASAASAVMGQAAEGRPIVLVRGLPYPAVAGRAADLVRPPEQDLFR
jgi:coenzyme F420-0:L-glutamate ligase/coenzyme F420-1:gamma-L-glutamate ligase